MVLRDNIDDLGAAAALQQVIDASRPRTDRVLSSETVGMQLRTHVSDVSTDSEDFVRNPYADNGRRPPRQEFSLPSSPLAVAHPAVAPETAESIEDDYVEVETPGTDEVEEEPQRAGRNLLTDPVGTLLHLGAAAALTAGSPGRQFITSGPPPPDQRGRRARRSSSQGRLLPTQSVPLSPVLARRPRAASDPAIRSRPLVTAHTRSVSTS